MQVAVIDYGSGNLRSVVRALRFVGARQVEVTADPQAVRAAERVVFPGQGAMGSCVKALRESGLDAALTEAIQRVPTLGICLGLQVLFERSQEHGDTSGLGLFTGEVRRFVPAPAQRLKIPHMGWNQVQHATDHPLWEGIDATAWFYFVHSFYVVPQRSDIVAGETEYGGVRFVSAVTDGMLFATQFHPEKSHDDGLRLLRNFLAWTGQS